MRLLFYILLAGTSLVVGCGNRPATSSSFEMRLVVTNASTNTEDLIFTNLLAVTDEDVHELLHVKKAALIDQTAVSSAEVLQYPGNTNLYIQVTFTEEGGRRFAEVTRQNMDKRLAIVVDGVVITAPIIKAEIPDGAALISGRFTKAEARSLAGKVNSAVKR